MIDQYVNIYEILEKAVKIKFHWELNTGITLENRKSKC